DLPEITVVGPRSNRVGSVAFLHNKVHAHDVAQILDSQNIAVRSGHHCTMPLHTEFSWPATVRASFNVYNTTDDIDALISGLEKVKTVFKI
ncbi:MAG: aminotransferase class V-fold PLP-dependent enzyme, partial [Candidatus Pacebacteria bacterium]|nr:aminotransferase class V-fold PLP-dependent enzyme [Candidatus Paceibacterota bacterium]